MSPRIAAVLAAASLGWGLAAVGVRAVFEEGVTTLTVVSARTGVATVAIVAVLLARRMQMSHRIWIDGAAIGVLRIGVAPILFIASLNFISAGFESLVITLIPVVTALLGYLLLGERVEGTQVWGFLFGLLGTVILIASGDSGISDGSGNTVVGGALALGGVLAGSSSGVVARKLSPRHDTVPLAVAMFVSGSIVVVLVGIALADIRFGGVSSKATVILVLLGLGSTFLPFVATLYASRHTTAARVALTGYVAPVIGVVGGAVLLGERITPAIVTGGILAMIGVVLAGRSQGADASVRGSR